MEFNAQIGAFVISCLPPIVEPIPPPIMEFESPEWSMVSFNTSKLIQEQKIINTFYSCIHISVRYHFLKVSEAVIQAYLNIVN